MYGFASEEDWNAWRRKRRKTLIGFVFVGAVVGIDSSVVFSTLYSYLKDTVRTESPRLWYGIITATFFTASSIFCGASGRWVDKTRRLRAYINFSLLIQATGFLIYAIPYSPWNLLFGRFLSGIGEPFMSVVTGEVFRIYVGQDSKVAILWLASTFSFGFIIGPSLNMLFLPIHFKIGWMTVNRMNFVAIFMAFLMSCIAVVAHFLVSNCSAEFDLKDYLTRQQKINGKEDSHKGDEEEEEEKCEFPEESELILQNSLCDEKSISMRVVVCTLLRNFDSALLFFSSFVLMFTIILVTTWVPLIVINDLKWGINGLSLFYAAYGIGALVTLLILSKTCRTNTSVYYISIASIIGQLVMFADLLIYGGYLEHTFWTKVIFMAVFTVTQIASWIFEDILVRIILANMIPSQIQSFAEGLRGGTARFGIIAGSFSSPFLYVYYFWTSLVLVVIIFVIIVIFALRRKYLLDPKQLNFVKTY